MGERGDGQARRAAGRSRWPVRKYGLHAQPGDDLSQTTTPAERIAMVELLTREAWALTGKALPVYSRAHSPVRVLRSGPDAPGR